MKWMLLLIGILFLADSLIESRLLLTQKADISLPTLPRSFHGIRIMQISDLHHRVFGKDNSRITARAKLLRPDIIVITGDLVSRDQRDFTAIGRFCRNLTEIAPVYFTPGNHELDLPPKVLETYLKTLRAAGVSVLWNDSVQLHRNEAVISLTGAALDISVYHNGKHRYGNLNPFSSEEITKQLGGRSECTILLAHNPLIASAYAQWNADLVLSGHVHGGVVRLPFIGGLLSPERQFFPRYAKGIYMIHHTVLYVSTGLGKFRFWNPPEVNLLTLHTV
ncbi:MAG: metallophosphoesterase [Ruminococcus sp.]|nr:metallophosphoesterase [Ruminococcus sp.]